MLWATPHTPMLVASSGVRNRDGARSGAILTVPAFLFNIGVQTRGKPMQVINAQNAIHRSAEASNSAEALALAQYFEPCMSCGRPFTQTAATITVLCVEGREEVVKVCPTCAKRRGLV